MNKLKGKVQHYAWGGHDYIPQLLNDVNFENRPYAEYWMGAHHSSPSEVETESTFVPLDKYLEENKALLGEKVTTQFGRLPYLFKVLDVKDMLSIQVHPSKEEAAKGFVKENQKGIPLNAAYRNYKDDNHKPEVMVALSDFWLLHGFKTEAKLLDTLERVPAFAGFADIFKTEGYHGLYKHVMELPQEKVDKLLGNLLKPLVADYKAGNISKEDPAYWASKVIVEEGEHYELIDRGIFSIYFFNILHLQKGQAIFQGAGVPHAYLQGQNIELMSNSDNVLRGGLTTKHVDVPELLKHTLFEGIEPVILNGESLGVEKIYRCPVPDFVVSNITLNVGESYTNTAYAAEILLLIEGECKFKSGEQILTAKKGEAVFLGSGETYAIETDSTVTIFKAAVPQ